MDGSEPRRMTDRAQMRESLLADGWLSAQPAEFQEIILEESKARFYPAGTMVYEVGDPPGGIYGVVSGTVAINIAPGETGPHVASVSATGDWFGEGGYLTRQPRRIGLVALCDSWLAHVSLARMGQITYRCPDACRMFGAIAMYNMENAIRAVEDLLNPSAERRFAATLWRCCAGRSGAGLVMTQAELGRVSNCSRKVVNRVVQKLEELGMVRQGYGAIHIVDAGKLRRFADGMSVASQVRSRVGADLRQVAR